MSNQNLPRYLYRALRPEEITAGIVLIPKARDVYEAEPILPEKLPFNFVDNPKSARQGHQHDSDRYRTSYVSTTPILERAQYYAAINKVIVTIDTATFDALGVVAHHVATEFASFQISKPQDDEFLLEYRGEHEFPKEIIADVEML